MNTFWFRFIVIAMTAAASNSLANESDEWKLATPPKVPSTIRVERDIAFLSSERKEKADLYFPDTKSNDKLFPAILLMHGGGFNDGDKSKGREVQMAIELTNRGYVCMSINYKLWNKGIKKSTWPQSLHDAKTAVRWLRVNADRLQIDADRIGAVGNSAGGNLAAMLATTSAADGLDPESADSSVSTQVACAVDFYGALDLLNYHDMKMFQQTREENPEVYRKASPITHASKGDAPLLIIHGDADKTVPLSQARAMAAILKMAGVPYQLEIIPDAPHTFYLVSKKKDFRPVLFEFLDSYLMNGQATKNSVPFKQP